MVEPTHVFKLQDCLVNDPRQDQVVAYFKGIGIDERYTGKVGQWLHKYGGGAFGWGLDVKVKQAYEFIAKVYKPGDEIYLFGFSRGAYTARSVAGLIRKCGIVEDTSPEGINNAFDLYRKRGVRNHPDSDRIWKKRRKMSPRFATSQSDLDRRGDGSELVNLAYVGVWDTVGAIGLPPSLLGPLAVIWNARYRFHDAKLSSLVRSARHAVAIDERRVLFRPALWENVAKLNGDAKGEDAPYQQLWFCGTHGVVGGSDADHQALSGLALEWVFEPTGLSIKPGCAIPLGPTDPAMETSLFTGGTGFLKSPRGGPKAMEELHASVRLRIDKVKKYRPGSLAKLFGF